MPPSCPPLLFDDGLPWHTETLPVSGGHRLQVSQHGHPQGQPVLLLHGGPGSGMSPLLRRFFDPARWRLIGLDQRGAGASRPAGEIRHNTTADLLADLRCLRAHLGLKRWLVVGGSWGATLALAHAADQPQAVSGLLLRAVFLARPADIAGFFRRETAPGPAAQAAWDRLAALLPGAEAQALLPALARALAADKPVAPVPTSAAQQALALAWRDWELALAGDPRPPALPASGEGLQALVQRYRVQAHYLQQGCWLQSPDLLTLADRRAPVPTLLLHGSADRICAPAGALALHEKLPHSRLQWVAHAGHDPGDPAMAAATVQALAQFAEQGHFGDPGPFTAPAAPGGSPSATGAAAPCRCA